MARNYNNRILRWVKPSEVFQNLKYGFQSGLDNAKKGDFGQTDVGLGDLNGLVIGANSPKPAKASRKFVTGTISSFCDYSKQADLRTKGYQVVSPKTKIRLARTSSLSKTMYVTINQINYAWQMPTLVGASADPTKVGAKVAAAGANDMIFGAAFPKPPRYKYVNDSTGDTFAIFGDPSTSEESASTAGFVVVSSGRFSASDLAQRLG